MKTILYTICGRASLVAASLFVLGCLPNTAGVEPPDDQLVFPVGVALASGSSELLVANSNFDLNYNAGTLVAMNVGALSSATGGFSNDGQFWYIDETELIDPAQTLRLGAFASDMGLTPDGKKLLIPVRGERSILVVDLNRGGRTFSCGQGEGKRCDQLHRVKSNENYSLPIEPYEVASVDYLFGDDDQNPSTRLTVGFATHLAGGEVSAYLVSEARWDDSNGVWQETDREPELLRVAGGIVPGASGLAVRQVPDASGVGGLTEILVTGRRASMPQVGVLRLLADRRWNYESYRNNAFFNKTASIDFGQDILSGTDSRGIAVSPDGIHGYVVSRAPSSLLLKIDLNTREFSDMATLAAEPSIVDLYESPNGDLYAFVLCFGAGQVFVVDVKSMQVLAVRSTGTGPHGMAFDSVNERAFITNFSESTITILSTKPPFDLLRHKELNSSSSHPGAVVRIGRSGLHGNGN